MYLERPDEEYCLIYVLYSTEKLVTTWPRVVVSKAVSRDGIPFPFYVFVSHALPFIFALSIIPCLP